MRPAVIAAALTVALLSACGPAPSSAPPAGATTAHTAAGSAPSSSSSPVTAPHPTPSETLSPSTTRSTVPSRPRKRRLSLTGTVEAGVERGCMVLTDEKTGLRVVLTGGRESVVRAGARITVVGHIREDLRSFCQQGPLFQVMMATAR